MYFHIMYSVSRCLSRFESDHLLLHTEAYKNLKDCHYYILLSTNCTRAVTKMTFSINLNRILKRQCNQNIFCHQAKCPSTSHLLSRKRPNLHTKIFLQLKDQPSIFIYRSFFEFPNLPASCILYFSTLFGLISPESPLSGKANFFTDVNILKRRNRSETTAGVSMDGSVTLIPPAIFRNTSF